MVDDLSAWLADLTLDPPVSGGDLAGPPHLDEDYVVISTIHSAKGLEWSVVHVLMSSTAPYPLTWHCAPRRARRGTAVVLRRRHTIPRRTAPLRTTPHASPPLRSGRSAQLHPLSRFMTDEVQAVLDVIDEKPGRMDVLALAARPLVVDLDPLLEVNGQDAAATRACVPCSHHPSARRVATN